MHHSLMSTHARTHTHALTRTTLAVTATLTSTLTLAIVIMLTTDSVFWHYVVVDSTCNVSALSPESNGLLESI